MKKLFGFAALFALLLGGALSACERDAYESDSSRPPQATPAEPEAEPTQPPAARSRPGDTPPQTPTSSGARRTDRPAEGAPQVNPDAATIKDFRDRIDAYVKLRGTHEKGSADPKETSDPAKIKATQDTLAARIQAARSDAKPGDIFTPEIRSLFRRLIYPEMSGPDAKATKETIRMEESAPTKAQVLKVNGRYPEAAALPTVPPNLLARLPQLPEELEYRIVNKDLILRDVNANLIVDFIPNAIR
jgi:hypothetical protein